MNTAPPLRIAIVGCGCDGTRCASLLGDARLVVVCDTDPRRAASLAATAHACFATNVLSEALSFLPDAVIVMTPSSVLATVASESLKAGAHVFVSRIASAVPNELAPVYQLAQHSRRRVAIESDGEDESLPCFLNGLKAALGF